MNFKRLFCFIGKHDFYEYSRPKESWGKGIRWIKCSRCNKDWAMNNNVKAFLPMDFELKDMHSWEKINDRQ